MKFIKANAVVSSCAACLVLLSASAFAGHAIDGTSVTETAELTFTGDSSVKIVITPVSGLGAGQVANKAVFGSVRVEKERGSPAGYGLRYTPGTFVDTGDYGVELSGKSNNNHKLKVKVFLASQPDETNYLPGNDWANSNGAVSDREHDLSDGVWRIISNADQSVPADSYVLSLDAVSWAS